MSRNWEVVRDFYQNTFDIPADLVDLVASSDVLLMCVSGASNESISSTLDIDIDTVSEILLTVIDFSGWSEDLDVNPYHIFTSMRTVREFSYEEFKHEISVSSRLSKSSDIDTMFRICNIFYDIDQRIEREWN